ncbi:hypothetical protein GCM10008938_12780 [Deinococcus roseus]|uniref:Type II toxin-antitoxin system HicB family antitoxin n=2 Tax=Deinococcus roseus TaxID=392414 RepID=A0ABQ2CWM8_9DEIO|nr:hypothetical protein GCM10008938_12780 [Deinococcus roseus]
MPWNYRVIHDEKRKAYAIHSVYYDEDLRIMGTSLEPEAPEGESLEDLRLTLELMLEALGEPVLPASKVFDEEKPDS